MKKYYIIFLLVTSIVSYSQSFHDTQGKLEITNSGQSTFTVPIAMPPSIMDVGPVINLQYSSGQNEGIAGDPYDPDTPYSSLDPEFSKFDYIEEDGNKYNDYEYNGEEKRKDEDWYDVSQSPRYF